MDNTDIVYQAKLHWIIFVAPLVCLIGFLALSLYVDLLRVPALLMSALMLIWFLGMYGLYKFCSLTIKKNQMILKKGFFNRKIMDIPLSKIESIDINQSLLGTILGYGNIVITGTGGTKEIIFNINKPLTCRRYVEQLLHG